MLTEFAAFTGAILGVLNLWKAALEPRPFVTLDAFKPSHVEKSFLRLSVINPSRFPILMKRARVYDDKFRLLSPMTNVSEWELHDVVKSVAAKRHDLLLRDGQREEIPFEIDEKNTKFIIILVSFARHRGFVIPLVPRLLIRWNGALRSLKAHPYREQCLGGAALSRPIK